MFVACAYCGGLVRHDLAVSAPIFDPDQFCSALCLNKRKEEQLPEIPNHGFLACEVRKLNPEAWR